MYVADRGMEIISIHTTAKVVTTIKIIAVNKTMISIHTTAKVVTGRDITIVRSLTDFNPHHREGGDQSDAGTYFFYNHFNPHHREGGD